ncbi:MAG: radical SAM protein [Phycisphaerae bacterium]|nr:radical SAM protein [Phycisphaerae bacterium]
MIRSLQDNPAVSAEAARSGEPARPIDCISRPAVTALSARTELEKFKVSMRRHDPLVKGLPWACQAHCVQCDQTVPAEFVLDAGSGGVALEIRCPKCGTRRERHQDAIFTTPRQATPAGQPTETLAGHPIRPVLRSLPRTVETLCPECSCVILGRYYVKDRVVYIEKTCPDHGYFRDKINTDVDLYLKGANAVFQDERGVCRPQVRHARRCPTDCGLCNQHLSASCLAQIDLSNRCNLNCPVCFANANQSGYVSEPDFAMVAEMLAALRKQQPYPATAIQFTGGEPTIHPEFHRIVRHAHGTGFSHIQIATNGIKMAEPEFAERAAEAGLHTLYLQFDGVSDDFYRKTRGQALMEKKLACVENCRRTGLKIVLVPTIIKGFNDDQVKAIFRFAVDNIEAISAISYQPVAFTGRIDVRDLEAQRYTLGDLAKDVAAVSGADLKRDFWPLGMLTPLSRIMECIDGKSKIRASCHSDCAFGTYFFVTPEKQAIPMPQLFDMYRIMDDFNRQAAGIQARRTQPEQIARANGRDLARIAWTFIKHYNWRQFFKTDIKPWTFIRALQGLTNKAKGRGAGERKSYKTLMAAGMHFMDRYNYDVERVRRCVIQYSTPDGIYPFCTINGGPTYRPFVERIHACSSEEYRRRRGQDGEPTQSSAREEVADGV